MRYVAPLTKPISGPGFGGLAALVSISSVCYAGIDIRDHLMPSPPEQVKLIRKLPAVAERNGRTVRFEPSLAGNTIPQDTAVILREKIRTLLLHAKEGEIQFVDGPADTVLRCIITGYEPMVQRPNRRQLGTKDEQVLTLIGNMEASVQVLDQNNRPLDAANLKQHLEKDYIIAQTEKKAPSLVGTATKSDKISGIIGLLKGGADTGDLARAVGARDSLHDALGSSVAKVERTPTEQEWKSAIVEGLALKVANRIVPVDEEFVAVISGEHQFAQVRELAKANRWGSVQEQLETSGPLQGNAEAQRLYLLGLSAEARAYIDSGSLDKAAELLNAASQKYKQAEDMQPRQREYLLAQIRAQESLDHYLEIQHYQQTAKAQGPPSAAPKATGNNTSAVPASSPSSKEADNGATNAKLVQMSAAGLPENILLTFVQTAKDPKFDVSADGLVALAMGKVPAKVIEAVQQKMADPAGKTVRRAAAPKPPAPAMPKAAPVAHTKP